MDPIRVTLHGIAYSTLTRGHRLQQRQLGIDPHHGFARIYCDACGHDYLLAVSCKTRTFCPSCHQQRVLLNGEWVEENVLAPVPHRQYVFTVPRLLRPILARCRARSRRLNLRLAQEPPGRG